ncbi:hypothetical protein NL676_013762 [Syzygium grande]|nr:hypothetical protein NL676_013762 [Syzygium grande]
MPPVIPRYPTAPRPCLFARGFPEKSAARAPLSSAGMREIMGLFIDKFSRAENGAVLGEGIRARVLELRDELVQLGGRDEIVRALEEKADPLLLSVDGLAFVELLKQLDAWPHQALEVLIRSTRSLSWQFCKD